MKMSLEKESTKCVTEKHNSEKKTMETQLNKDTNISSPDVCYSEHQASINQYPDKFDASEVQKVLHLDSNCDISSPDICDSDIEDSINEINITILDSEQMIKLFPEMSIQSATNANVKETQADEQFANEIANKENLRILDSEKICLAVSEDVDEIPSSSNENVFCCLYGWLSSLYAGVPKCSCLPINKRYSTKSHLKWEETNGKEVDKTTTGNCLIIDSSTETVEPNDANKLSLEDKCIKRHISTMSNDIKRKKAVGDPRPIKVEHTLAESKLYQPLDKKESVIIKKNPEQEKEIRSKHHVVDPTSEQALQQKDFPFNNSGLPEVEHNYFKNNFPAETNSGIFSNLSMSPNRKKKPGTLIDHNYYLRERHSTYVSLKKVKLQELKLNERANKERLDNKAAVWIEISKFQSDNSQSQSEKELGNSEVKTLKLAENKPLNKEKVPSKQISAAERIRAEIVEPQCATVKKTNINEINRSKGCDTNCVKRRALRKQECFQCQKIALKTSEKKLLGSKRAEPN